MEYLQANVARLMRGRGVSMYYRNLLGYFIFPAMMAVVSIAACAPRLSIEDKERLPPLRNEGGPQL
jgi:hypothetical protein